MLDPFSEVLSVLGTHSVRGTSLKASGDWALSFDGSDRLKFVAIIKGCCWLTVPGQSPEALCEGDVILLANTRYIVASNPTVKPSDGMPLYALPGHDAVQLGDGAETVMIGGGSGFAEGCASFVLDSLPPFLRVKPPFSSTETVTRVLASLHDEACSERVGSSLVAERLADILVVEAIRAYVAVGTNDAIGWIAALGDPRIAKALALMHGDIGRRWTIQLLAREVGMSRSALTLRFSQRVGRPPLDYLTRWRMVLAQRKLTKGESIAKVAEDVGYASQSAFAHAFKRTMGRTPRSV